MARERELCEEEFVEESEEDCQAPDAPAVEDLMDEIEGLKQELAQVKEENKALVTKCQRAQADFQNLKRRSENEKEEIVKFALEEFLIKLLPVVDNLERAIRATEADADVSNLTEGLNLVYRQLCDVLQREGLSPIEAVGNPFDPFQHEAMASEETDEFPDGTIIEELQRGYEFRGKVIRYTLVKVAKFKGE